MCEILSRGKLWNSGEWIEGYYVHLYDGRGNESHRIYTGYAETDCGEFYPVWCEVDPDTVGRYTGLTDKNGVKVFEGNILRSHYDDGWPDDGTIEVVVWSENGWGLEVPGGDVSPMLDDGVLPYSEVIGNIHDDPGLLEGGGKMIPLIIVKIRGHRGPEETASLMATIKKGFETGGLVLSDDCDVLAFDEAGRMVYPVSEGPAP